MWMDFALAALHHLLLFGLIAMLVAESVLLSRPLDAAGVGRLLRLDRGYGLTAGLLLGAGLWRVFGGIKGADFYLHNPWFHAKLGCFVLRWRRALTGDAAFLPSPAETARVRGAIRFQLGLIALIFVLAAGMARYGGLRV
ncbi:DUF2214 family protein [Pseudoxanthomonas winnipegensis]|uniref:DUF2214 family protein n=1 Tax=Pseudoxanthomonas winnipegensis TaxID=2480810 RepID=UPI0030F37249